MTKYIFVDRDGTLIIEPSDHQIDSLEKFRLLPGVIPALIEFTRAGYKLVMVTNQDALGTPANPQEKFDMIQDLLLGVLDSQGIRFADILICPHTSADGCRCRKPATQLVQRYIASNEMDRENSFVIGDRATDLQLAENMGLCGYQIGGALDWSTLTREILKRPRTAHIQRQTNETDIDVRVALDGGERCEIQTGLGFFDHMLEQLSRHGGFDLQIRATGDLHIDDHHLVEDVGLALGAALRRALGEKRGIQRYGFWLPMDEAHTRVTLDLSGRASFHFRATLPSPQVGGLASEMVPHFFRSLADSLAMSLHIECEGENTHHMVESMFKATGRALRSALAKTSADAIPSSKGSL